MALGKLTKVCKREGCDSVFESRSSSNKVYCSNECRYLFNQVGLRVGDNKGAHGLTNINEDTLEATCKSCGNVRIRKRTNHGKYGTTITWRCYTRELQLSRARRYSLSPEDFDDLLTNQDNNCKICSIGIRDNPHIDHDHDTGKVRGLLCGNCNTGIGLLKEDVNILLSAIDYLLSSRKEAGNNEPL